MLKNDDQKNLKPVHSNGYARFSGTRISLFLKRFEVWHDGRAAQRVMWLALRDSNHPVCCSIFP
jgi:hypothetical protein